MFVYDAAAERSGSANAEFPLAVSAAAQFRTVLGADPATDRFPPRLPVVRRMDLLWTGERCILESRADAIRTCAPLGVSPAYLGNRGAIAELFRAVRQPRGAPSET
jgi:hypothetical protein